MLVPTCTSEISHHIHRSFLENTNTDPRKLFWIVHLRAKTSVENWRCWSKAVAKPKPLVAYMAIWKRVHERIDQLDSPNIRKPLKRTRDRKSHQYCVCLRFYAIVLGLVYPWVWCPFPEVEWRMPSRDLLVRRRIEFETATDLVLGLSVSHACFHWTLCMVDISGTHGGSRWTRTWDTKDAQCSVYFCEIWCKLLWYYAHLYLYHIFGTVLCFGIHVVGFL